MRLSVLFLLITVLIDAMGIGLIIPVMPDLLRDVTGGTLSDAALWGGVLSTVYAVMQFLFAPFLGHLSDIYGRRRVLLSTLVVVAIDYALMGFVATLWLLIGVRAIGGIASATQATATAAMADLSKAEDRAKGFGMINAAFGMGFVLGPIIGGFLGELGPRAPFWAAGILAGLNALLGYFAFPETAPKNRPKFDLWRANPFGTFRALSRLGGMMRGFVIYFLYQVSFSVYPATWAYFCQARFGWDTGMVGLSLGMFGVFMALFQAVLIRPILKRVGERGTIVLALSAASIGYISIAFVTSGTLALLLTPLAALGSIFLPALQALLSQNVSADRQGELQGGFGATAAIAMVLSPLLMTSVFAYFTAPENGYGFAGAPFIVACILAVLALGLFLNQRALRAIA